MKHLLTFAILIAHAVTSIAGTAVTVKNRALNFDLIMSASGDGIYITNNKADYEFDYLRTEGNKDYYRETNNKCVISIKYVSEDYAEGKTKNEHMLSMEGFVVQAEENEENCKLDSPPNGKRSLTGIYLQ